MALLPGTKNEIKQHIDAGFTDTQGAESLNASGFTTSHGKPWTKIAFAYHRQQMGIKKPGGHLTKRRRNAKAKRMATETPVAAEPRLKASPSKTLKEACAALLDCAPAQRAERIELVFKLLGVQ